MDTGGIEDGRRDIDDVMELAADAALILDALGPGYRHALCRPAIVRSHLLHPLERRGHRPRPAGREVREGLVGPPERVPEELGINLHGDAVEGGELVRCAVAQAFGARPVVAGNVDDEGVVELTQVLNRLDEAADLMVRIGEEGGVNVHLLDEQPLLHRTERVPLGQFLRPGR